MRRRSLVLGLCALSLTIWNGVARASDGSAPAAAPALVAIEPMIVPIIDHGVLIGRVEVKASWKADNADQAAEAEQRLPSLRAALVSGAADYARVAATPGQAVDPTALAAQLEDSARRQGFTGELLVLEAVSRSA